MIVNIRGLLISKKPSKVIIDVGGLGYECLISTNTYDQLPNINVEVNSIRLEESSETPILLLLDPSTQKVLPIWIGTIEAVSIAYAQEGILHDRPQTHDLLLNIVEALEGSISEVNISNIEDSTYFADIILNTVNGLVTLSARPSDAIALALRSNIPVTVNQEVFETNSIDLIIDNANEIEEFKEFIKDIKPEDFS